MITLTTPHTVEATLGTVTGGISYDRFETTLITIDVVNKTIYGNCRLVSSGTPMAPTITGTFAANAADLNISIPTLNVSTTIALTPAQQTTLATQVSTTQNQIESDIVSLAAVVGAQSPGL